MPENFGSGLYPDDHPVYGTRAGKWPFTRNAALELVFDATGQQWWFAGKVGDTYPELESALTCVRASAGMAQEADGSWTTFPANTIRRTALGLLVEEARTNAIPNNSLQGAVAGSPGTLPTGVSLSNPTGLTRTLSLETIGGVEYLRVRLQGTASSTTGIQINFNTSSDTAAADAQTWAASAFFQPVRSTGLVQTDYWLLEAWNFATGNVFIGTGSATVPGGRTTVAPGALSRLVTTRAISAAPTTANIRASIRLQSSITSGDVVDVEFLVGWPQLELCGSSGAFATSPIRTTVAAASRAADVITSTNPTILAAINADTVSLLYQATGPNLTGSAGSSAALLQGRLAGTTLALDDRLRGSPNQMYAAAGQGAAILYNSGAAALGITPLVEGGPLSIVARHRPTGVRLAQNGGIVAADTAVTKDNTITTVTIGSTNGASAFWNSYIRRIAFLGDLTDAEMIALTL